MNSIECLGELPLFMSNGTSISKPLVFEAARELTGAIYGDIVSDSAYIAIAEVHLNQLIQYLKYNVSWRPLFFGSFVSSVSNSRAPLLYSIVDFASHLYSHRYTNLICPNIHLILSQCSKILQKLTSLPLEHKFAGGDRPSVGDCSMAASIYTLYKLFSNLRINIRDCANNSSNVRRAAKFLFGNVASQDIKLVEDLCVLFSSLSTLVDTYVVNVEDVTIVLASSPESAALRVVEPSLSECERTGPVKMIMEAKKQVMIPVNWPLGAVSNKKKPEEAPVFNISNRRKLILYSIYAAVAIWTGLGLLSSFAPEKDDGEEDEE